MTKLSYYKMISAIAVICAATALTAQAQTFKIVGQFNGQNGAEPYSAVTQGADGRLYGTTSRGSLQTNDLGTLFVMDTSGNLTTLVDFNDALCGPTDYSPLLLTPNGMLLGAGCNLFYEVTGNQKFNVIYGGGLGDPMGSIAEGVDGSVYGTETNGGTGDCGDFNCGAGWPTLSASLRLPHPFAVL